MPKPSFHSSPTSNFSASVAGKKPEANPPSRVLIIGVGAAGLAAAERVRQAGLLPVVIEARNRIGGRVWTVQEGFDLGASWIQGSSGNPLCALAQRAGAQIFNFDFKNRLRFRPGGVLTRNQDEQIDQEFQRLEAWISEQQNDASSSAALDNALQNYCDQLSISARTDLQYAIRTNILLEYAADSQDLSLEYFDEGEEHRGANLMLPEGYAKLLFPLQNEDEIHLGHEVRSIDWTGCPIKVQSQQATFFGDFAIITLPLGVLKADTVNFIPPLPKNHRRAIQSLGFGTLNKLILKFPNIFWPPEKHLFGFVGDGCWEEWINLFPVTGTPALMGFSSGHHAEAMEKMTDHQICQSAMETLRQIFGPSLPDPIKVIATRWKRDPYSLGSYSAYAPGSTPADRAALAAPISNRITLAGEACSLAHPSTVHGAIESGRQAADLILDSASQISKNHPRDRSKSPNKHPSGCTQQGTDSKEAEQSGILRKHATETNRFAQIGGWMAHQNPPQPMPECFEKAHCL
ncbi:MAG: flavin monoamine oxidase family protein [Puniceicoccaceae bacterium]